LGDLAAIDVARLRIGWYDEDGILPSSPAIKRAVREAAQALGAAGATMVPWQPPGIDEAAELALSIFTADGGAFLKQLVAGGP
ncbi:UNVERIFIED_CONTAM: amidase, partial [Bacteroidetes bacterium 56_B9]